MATIMFQVQIIPQSDAAYICKVTTGGQFLSMLQVSIQQAKQFISKKSLGFMLFDGETEYYW